MSDLDAQQIRQWWSEPAHDPYRVLLIEAEHSDGVIRLADQPHLSSAHQAYDDWLVGSPFLVSTLDRFSGIGDFQAINPHNPRSWVHHRWTGYPCRWYIGDLRWPHQRFVQIGAALIDQVRFEGGNQFSFELIDPATPFRRSLVDLYTTRTESIGEAISFLVAASGQSIQAGAELTDRLAWPVSYVMQERTTAENVLRLLAASMNAQVRVDPLGQVQLVRPNGIPEHLGADQILASDLSVRTIIPPVQSVTVSLNDGTELHEGDLGDAAAGFEHLVIETALSDSGHAQIVLDEQVSTRSNPGQVWVVPVHRFDQALVVGGSVSVDHPQLSGTGQIMASELRPGARVQELEIIV